ncbi:MAG TPA: YiiX/YebB-like N1pC/P60 family cysteine hydrolase [Victivallales bacterium]|nr:YiiX/YebB-like N1pC/P60 family cysteine hydrolase [Victivallales bacterium]
MKSDFKNKYFLAILSGVFLQLLTGCTTDSYTNKNIRLKPGDLLFQTGKRDSFTDAVEKVTDGYLNAKFSHVALVARNKQGKLVVIQATDKVNVTPISDFLHKSLDKNGNPRVVAGRLIPKYRYLIPKAVAFAFKQVGKPYNDDFNINNTNAYYCSQLIYQSYKAANDNKPLFKLYPMTFKNPDTGKIFWIWVKYFKELKSPVPQGKPGCNPGGISMSNKIKIIHAFGIPYGWTEKTVNKINQSTAGQQYFD